MKYKLTSKIKSDEYFIVKLYMSSDLNVNVNNMHECTFSTFLGKCHNLENGGGHMFREGLKKVWNFLDL